MLVLADACAVAFFTLAALALVLAETPVIAPSTLALGAKPFPTRAGVLDGLLDLGIVLHTRVVTVDPRRGSENRRRRRRRRLLLHRAHQIWFATAVVWC